MSDSGKSRYMYGIVREDEKREFGPIGLEDKDVIAIPKKDIAAVVHECGEEPYQADEEDVIKDWISTHQGVLDRLIEEYDNLLPARFNTIFRPTDDKGSEEVLRDWLGDNYEKITSQLEEFLGKREYGVKIYYDESLALEEASNESEEVEEMEKKIEEMSSGRAYMYKQKLEKLRVRSLGNWVDERRDEFLARIKDEVSKISRGELKPPNEDLSMMLNLSCLLDGEHESRLGDVLEGIDDTQGFAVRFTGPWPPFSFTDLGEK